MDRNFAIAHVIINPQQPTKGEQHVRSFHFHFCPVCDLFHLYEKGKEAQRVSGMSSWSSYNCQLLRDGHHRIVVVAETLPSTWTIPVQVEGKAQHIGMCGGQA